jgi:hypothetical protein
MRLSNLLIAWKIPLNQGRLSKAVNAEKLNQE